MVRVGGSRDSRKRQICCARCATQSRCECRVRSVYNRFWGGRRSNVARECECIGDEQRARHRSAPFVLFFVWPASQPSIEIGTNRRCDIYAIFHPSHLFYLQLNTSHSTLDRQETQALVSAASRSEATWVAIAAAPPPPLPAAGRILRALRGDVTGCLRFYWSVKRGVSKAVSRDGMENRMGWDGMG